MFNVKVEEDSAQVRIPPPLVFLGLIGAGILLGLFFPLNTFHGPIRFWSAITLIAMGIAGGVSCGINFKKMKTNVEPWKSTSTIISTGLFRYSRNPIYLSAMLLMAGIGFALGNSWIVAFVIPFFLFLNSYAIPKEERYLSQKFGESYETFKSKVRRWI